MSTRRPGPPPAPTRRPGPAVYRRRRIVAVLLLLAVLAVLAWGITALVGALAGAADDVAPADAAPAPSPTEPPSPEACTARDLTVDVTGPEQAAVGGAVPVSLAVTNTGPGPCLVDAAALATTVRSGEDRVWSSADCPAASAERLLLLDVDDTTRSEVTWPGTRSAPGCPGDQGTAGPGSYQVEVELDGAPVGKAALRVG